jgi:aminopeptidase N
MEKDNLARQEAEDRSALVRDVEYDVTLDLLQDDHFVSETVVRFTATEPGASTFLDLTAPAVRSVELNGDALPQDVFTGNRVHLPRLEASNEVRVVAEGAYRTTGKGLNRFRDPVDDRLYVHSDFEPFDAHRGYACFDQPDVKGVFRFGATVPSGWEVLSNARATGPPEEEGGVARWRFEPTSRIPPYITVLCAGPFHGVHDRHGQLDLGLYCRKSLARYLEPEEWFEITKQGFDFFEDAFGYPYPFGDKYDQIVVPEFAAGAMENAGCVTFHERYVFRSRVTRTEREWRAGTILHEMAHMWFGDLVTMRWWDDLWLNESFATYAGTLAEAEATRFTEAWTSFANVEKSWAYQQDELPTTHPIVADIPDVQTVHLNFDGITYAKGASVLHQLVEWVGRDRFMEGMRVYFARHEFGNATLADFLAALEEASGRDLGVWSKEWLETAGVNRLRAETVERDGAYASVAVLQEPPEGRETLRSHRLGIGLYDEEGGRLTRRRQLRLDVEGERTEVGDLAGERPPDLLLLNEDDLTFTRVLLDDRSVEALRTGLGGLEDSLNRVVSWRTCWAMTRSGELPARRFLETVLRHGERETEIEVLEAILAQANRAVTVYGDPANREAAGHALAEASLAALERAEPGSDSQLAWARSFISSARSSDHVAAVRGLLDGSVGFEGLTVDTDLRWFAVEALAAGGEADGNLIEAEARRDPTDKGARHAAAARAARPSAEAKAEAWSSIVDEDRLSLAMANSIMQGFQRPEQEPLLAEYRRPYFDALTAVWEGRELPFALSFAERLYPRHVVEPRTVELTDEHLSREGLPSPIRRLLLEGRDAVVRSLRARRVDARA